MYSVRFKGAESGVGWDGRGGVGVGSVQLLRYASQYVLLGTDGCKHFTFLNTGPLYYYT